MNIFSKIKYPILKAIDVSGLTFLAPIVRLSYGEEPSVQLKKIGQWIVVPILAILVFIVAWFAVSKNVKTKSGSLPNPSETLSSYNSINLFADREQQKRRDYNLTGADREEALAEAEAALEKVPEKIAETTAGVEKAKKEDSAAIGKEAAPLQETYDSLRAKYDKMEADRKAEIAVVSEALQPGDKAAYTSFAELVAANEAASEEEQDELALIKNNIKEIRDQKSPVVAKALRLQTEAAEEKLFLEKRIDQLTRDNRSLKIEAEKEKIETEKAELAGLTGADALKKARSIAKRQERLQKTIDSEYAMPKTLWYQVRRSVLCVFTGFILGSAIAIPIGILCGLSSTFMAAMTPFIASFKPVSPIVWLPICLIIASFYVPSPAESKIMEWLWEAPLIGSYEINPAFIASAITVALCSLWATLANTALGVASIDKDHLNVARVLRLGFWPRLFKIVIPSALPLIFAGLRISLGVGWMVLIAAELLASSEGIGKFVWDQFNNGASDSFAKMVVVVFLVGLVGLILDRIMIVFQRLVSFEGSPTAI
ncbi:MAG: ABC transporter permease subunit [Luteolibacter sp.]